MGAFFEGGQGTEGAVAPYMDGCTNISTFNMILLYNLQLLIHPEYVTLSKCNGNEFYKNDMPTQRAQHRKGCL